MALSARIMCEKQAGLSIGARKPLIFYTGMRSREMVRRVFERFRNDLNRLPITVLILQIEVLNDFSSFSLTDNLSIYLLVTISKIQRFCGPDRRRISTLYDIIDSV